MDCVRFNYIIIQMIRSLLMDVGVIFQVSSVCQAMRYSSIGVVVVWMQGTD